MSNGQGTTDFPRELRFVFVQMLFALTMGEIARQIAALVAQAGICDATSSYTHLILATFLVATSWVGWTRSEASKKLRVEDVFSWPFVVLLLDVFLVICYFIVVKGAEMPNSTGDVTPSAENEAFWVLIVFVGYLLWDFLTKAVIIDPPTSSSSTPVKGSPPSSGRPTLRQRFFGRRFWERGWISLVCTTLALLAWLLLRSASTLQSVVLVDITLLSLVLLFRALKQEKWTVASLLGVALFDSLPDLEQVFLIGTACQKQ